MPEWALDKQYRQSRQGGIAMRSGVKQLSQTSELRTCPCLVNIVVYMVIAEVTFVVLMLAKRVLLIFSQLGVAREPEHRGPEHRVSSEQTAGLTFSQPGTTASFAFVNQLWCAVVVGPVDPERSA